MRFIGLAAIAAVFLVGLDVAEAQTLPPAQAERERGCDQGDAAMCGSAASALIETDRGRALTLLERGCRGGDRRSCGALGLMLVSGREAERDYARAAPLLASSCDDGVGAACGALSNILFVGAGVPVDQAQALARADRGCALEDARACAALGVYLSAGDVFPRDLGRAGPALVKACAATVANACEFLEIAAIAVIEGADPRIGRSSGLQLFEAACMGGQPKSCGALGAFLSEGLFAAADYPQAACVLRVAP